MAKKVYTPEEYKAKLEKKADKRKRFSTVFVKTIALALGCAMVYTTTVIAYKKVNNPVVVTSGSNTQQSGTNNNNSSQQGGSNSQSQSGDNNSQPSGGDNQQSTDNNSSQQGGDNQQSADNNSSQQGSDNQQNADKPAGNSLLTDKNAQFEYFVTSFKNVKTKAKTANNYKKKGSNYKGIAEAGMFSSTLSMLMNNLLKEEELTDANYSGADIMANFPPAGTECNLQKKDIAGINLKEEGDYYIVTVKVKGSVNPAAGTGVAAIGSAITREQIMEPISGIPGLNKLDPTCTYDAASCEAKIEKATGNMVHYYIDLPLVLSFEKQGYKVGLEFQEWWEMTY